MTSYVGFVAHVSTLYTHAGFVTSVSVSLADVHALQTATSFDAAVKHRP